VQTVFEADVVPAPERPQGVAADRGAGGIKFGEQSLQCEIGLSGDARQQPIALTSRQIGKIFRPSAWSAEPAWHGSAATRGRHLSRENVDMPCVRASFPAHRSNETSADSGVPGDSVKIGKSLVPQESTKSRNCLAV